MINSCLSEDGLNQLQKYTRLLVAFSGGLDSCVLLDNLAKYKAILPPIQAIHIHHGLSNNADLWFTHCEQFCLERKIPLIGEYVTFDKTKNVEAGARKARYAIFASYIQKGEALLLAHHQDDQVETFLLQLCRGAGIDGLSAMIEKTPFEKGTLLRPFLHISRQNLEIYAHHEKLSWVDDESNSDIAYSRNYIRHQVIPILKKKWPSVHVNIARTAKHCQDARLHLETLAEKDLGMFEEVLSLDLLDHLPPERAMNALRLWLKKNHIQLPSTKTLSLLIKEIIVAKRDANPQISWGRVMIRRYQEKLYLVERKIVSDVLCYSWNNFPEPLILNHLKKTLVPNSVLEGLSVPKESNIEIRFRQGGEIFFWHNQHKSLKKLMQAWKILPWERDLIPLLYIDDKLAMVVGYAISDWFYSKSKDCYQVNSMQI